MRAKAVDANQKNIMKLCRQIPGVSVVTIHTIGKGVPDLILGYKGRNFLIELKDGSKFKSAKKLTDDEIDFHRNWNGQVCVVESIDDVLNLLNK